MRALPVEPYVVAADVYAHPDHVGRGGLDLVHGLGGLDVPRGLEEILGLRRHGATLEVSPCIPAAWPGYTAEWKVGRSSYRIEVKNPARRSRGVARALLDGRPVDARSIPIEDDGRSHRVELVLGDPEPAGRERGRGGEALPQPPAR